MKNPLSEVPQIRQTENNWHMHVSFSPEFSLDLQIKYAFHGESSKESNDIKAWNEYKFFVWTEGDSFQLVSSDAWSEWYESIVEHEGEEVAETWAQKMTVRCSTIHGSDAEPLHKMYAVFEEMVSRWEAMQTLRLFTPTVTMSSAWDR